jgi:hypothetical protein
MGSNDNEIIRVLVKALTGDDQNVQVLYMLRQLVDN